MEFVVGSPVTIRKITTVGDPFGALLKQGVRFYRGFRVQGFRVLGFRGTPVWVARFITEP